MRKTDHNPRGFERNSWNWRVLQIRHALGWTQERLATVMSVEIDTVRKLEWGTVTRPSLKVIRKIKNIESAYEDIIKWYKRAPVRMDRLARQTVGRVRLLPIEVRRPEDIESLGEMEANSEPLFFGRKSRNRMPQTGMAERHKQRIAKRGRSISQAMRAKIATGWSPHKNNKKTQSGQSNDDGNGTG